MVPQQNVGHACSDPEHLLKTSGAHAPGRVVHPPGEVLPRVATAELLPMNISSPRHPVNFRLLPPAVFFKGWYCTTRQQSVQPPGTVVPRLGLARPKSKAELRKRVDSLLLATRLRHASRNCEPLSLALRHASHLCASQTTANVLLYQKIYYFGQDSGLWILSGRDTKLSSHKRSGGRSAAHPCVYQGIQLTAFLTVCARWPFQVFLPRLYVLPW